ncbi:hypothetical protein D3C77_627780 [compost metagenome]
MPLPQIILHLCVHVMNFGIAAAPQHAHRFLMLLLDGEQPVSQVGMYLQITKLAQHRKKGKVHFHFRRIELKQFVQHRP